MKKKSRKSRKKKRMSISAGLRMIYDTHQVIDPDEGQYDNIPHMLTNILLDKVYKLSGDRKQMKYGEIRPVVGKIWGSVLKEFNGITNGRQFLKAKENGSRTIDFISKDPDYKSAKIKDKMRLKHHVQKHLYNSHNYAIGTLNMRLPSPLKRLLSDRYARTLLPERTDRKMLPEQSTLFPNE